VLPRYPIRRKVTKLLACSHLNGTRFVTDSKPGTSLILRKIDFVLRFRYVNTWRCINILLDADFPRHLKPPRHPVHFDNENEYITLFFEGSDYALIQRHIPDNWTLNFTTPRTSKLSLTLFVRSSNRVWHEMMHRQFVCSFCAGYTCHIASRVKLHSPMFAESWLLSLHSIWLRLS